MKNSNRSQLRSAILAIISLVTLLLHNNPATAQTNVVQSNCFTMSFVTGSVGSCSPNDCGPNRLDPHQCTKCIKVTICSDKCPGLNPTSFKISAFDPNPPNNPYDQVSHCRSYCPDTNCSNAGNPNDSTDVGNYCSFQGPRVMNVSSPGGLADGACITFLICQAVDLNDPPPGGPILYKIDCNCSCSGVPCTVGSFVF